MKRLKQNKSGFTLIEIIIVIIILGVLAGLAMPKIVANIGRSRAAEAVNQLGTIARFADDCISMQGGGGGVAVTGAMLAACDTLAEIGVAVPGNASFAYGGLAAAPWTVVVGPPATIAVVATSIANAADTITFTYNATAGGVPVANKVGAGIFQSIRFQ